MTDQELADKVVALGVGEHWTSMGVKWYRLINRTMSMSEQEKYFVRDWRVAGVMIEKVCDKECDQSLIGSEDEFEQILVGRGGDGFFCDVPTMRASLDIGKSNESLPRAIIESCAEALS